MPTKPQVKTLNANSVEILNTLRANASPNYQDMVPYAEGSLDSVREIGAIIMQYPALQNEFLSALVNRIGMVLVTSKLYRNPWAFMKQGMLEFGETIEETVHREVMEEVGLKVKNLRYYKSQPWSFSGTLLFGFFCDVDGDGTLTVDHEELSVAQWFDRDKIIGQDTDSSLTNEMMMVFAAGKEPK